MGVGDSLGDGAALGVDGSLDNGGTIAGCATGAEFTAATAAGDAGAAGGTAIATFAGASSTATDGGGAEAGCAGADCGGECTSPKEAIIRLSLRSINTCLRASSSHLKGSNISCPAMITLGSFKLFSALIFLLESAFHTAA